MAVAAVVSGGGLPVADLGASKAFGSQVGVADVAGDSTDAVFTGAFVSDVVDLRLCVGPARIVSAAPNFAHSEMSVRHTD